MHPVNLSINDNIATRLSDNTSSPILQAELNDPALLDTISTPASSPYSFSVLRNQPDLMALLTAPTSQQPAATSGGGVDAALGALNGMSSNINDLLDQMKALDPKSPSFAADSAQLQIELQMANQQMQNLVTTLTQIVKAQGDAQMAVAHNI